VQVYCQICTRADPRHYDNVCPPCVVGLQSSS
jgi:hypothetical protein